MTFSTTTANPEDSHADFIIAYSIADLAHRLGVSQRHVQRLVSRGELPSVKLGRRRLIARDTVSAWLSGKTI